MKPAITHTLQVYYFTNPDHPLSHHCHCHSNVAPELAVDKKCGSLTTRSAELAVLYRWPWAAFSLGRGSCMKAVWTSWGRICFQVLFSCSWLISAKISLSTHFPYHHACCANESPWTCQSNWISEQISNRHRNCTGCWKRLTEEGNPIRVQPFAKVVVPR